MLSGAVIVGDSGKRRKLVKKREDERSKYNEGMESWTESKSTSDVPLNQHSSSNSTSHRPDEKKATLSASLQSSKRDPWMMGEFDSLLESHKTESRTNKIEDLYTRKRRNLSEQSSLQLELNGREAPTNNPNNISGGVGPQPFIQCKFKKIDITVGDGGRAWRERAARRRNEVTKNPEMSTQPLKQFHTAGGRDVGVPHWGKKHSGNSRNWAEQSQGFNKKWSKSSKQETSNHLIEENSDNWQGNRSNIDQEGFPGEDVSRIEYREDEKLRNRRKDIGRSEKDTEDANDSENDFKLLYEEEDPNVIASQALKCLMAGDEEGFQRLEAQKAKLIEAQQHQPIESEQNQTRKSHKKRKEEIKVLEDVDASGRYKPLAVVRTKRESLSKTGEPFDNDGHYSVAELYRQTRVEREPDYDKKLEDRILKNTSKQYRGLQEYDDEVASKKEKKISSKCIERKQKRERLEMIRDTQRLAKTLEKCLFCPEAPKFQSARGQSLIAMSSVAYLCFQSIKQCVVKYHLFIAPISHTCSSIILDEDCYQDMRNFQKSLIRFLDAQSMAAIFVECSPRVVSMEKAMLGGGNHMTIDCFGVDVDRIGEAKAYFKKALSEIGNEWSQHRKIIDVPPGRKQGCRGVIPKNFPFFHVDFNLGGGMAHIIEDNEFSRSLGRDIIQGMMQLDSNEGYYKSYDDYSSTICQFKHDFTPYDWTSLLRT